MNKLQVAKSSWRLVLYLAMIIYSKPSSHVKLTSMKWYRITAIAWQLAICLALVTLLHWESTPVPGLDGRVVCEVYEFPFAHREEYRSITISETQPEWKVLVRKAPIVEVNRKEPNQRLQWLIKHAPFVKDLLPKKYRHTVDGGQFMVISLTLEEWKCLQTARRKDSGHFACHLYE